MSTDLSTRLASQVEAGPQDGPSVYDLVRRQRDQIALALPGSLDADRFARIVVTELRKTPKLAACTAESLLGAMMSTAQLGLEPGPLQQVYLIPRWNGKQRVNEVQLMIGYRGIIDLAMRSGRVKAIDAHVVYSGDFFDYEYGTAPHLTHRPALTNRGEPVAAYAVAQLVEGGAPFVVLSVDEINARRGRSQSGDRGPWSTDWDAMARKSAVRALAPFLPQSTDFAQAQQIDETVRTDYASQIDEAPVRVWNETDPESGALTGPVEVVTDPPGTDPDATVVDSDPETDGFPPQSSPLTLDQRIAMWCREAGFTNQKERARVIQAWSLGACKGSKDVPAGDAEHLRQVLKRIERGEVKITDVDGQPRIVDAKFGFVQDGPADTPEDEEPF